MTENNGSVPGRGGPTIRFHLPAPRLRDFVTSYYVLDAPGPLVDYTHPEWANIRFALSGRWLFADMPDGEPQDPGRTSLFGSSDRTKRFWTEEGGSLLGIGLTPLGWLSLVGTNAAAAANRVLPLGNMLGVAADDLLNRLTGAPDEAAQMTLLDDVLTARAKPAGPYHEIARSVQAALMTGEADQVTMLAEIVGVESRTLLRVCTSVFGFPPVQLLRRQRFLRTLTSVQDALDKPIGQLIDAQYYDQAHFNRDFRAHMGMTPHAYFNLPREALRRAAEERRRVLGAPVQGLHALSKSKSD